MNRRIALSSIALSALLLMAGCAAEDGSSCTVADNGDGTHTISCGDGTTAVVMDGMDGTSGACSVTDNGDGTKTIDCDDGTSVTVEGGADGTDGDSCTVTDNGDGTYDLTCEDGTSVTISDGADGTDGDSCTVVDNGDGTYTVSCEDGTSVTFSDGADGTNGADGDSCTVTDNGDGTYTLSCEDGTSVVISDGADADADGVDAVIFPATGDTRSTAIGTRFWNDGDFVEGTRTTTLSSLSRVELTLDVGPNGLSCDTQDVDLIIDGTTVGSISIASGDEEVVASFPVTGVTGPDYTFRLETTRTVSGGCGAAGYVNDTSTIVLIGTP